MFPTFYRSPDSVASAVFATASGLISFKHTVEARGGSFFGRNDLGAIVFRGSRFLAASIALAGYDVTVHEGPPPDDALRANTKWHARTGGPTAWAAVRKVGVAVKG
jgi:hypothetical protein